MKQTRLHIFAGLGVAVLTFALSATPASADGFTPWAVPESVERTSGGMLVHGDYGDVNGCGIAGKVFYPASQQDYEVFVSMMLTAITAGRQVRFWIVGCTTVAFHWGASPVINLSADGNGFMIQ